MHGLMCHCGHHVRCLRIWVHSLFVVSQNKKPVRIIWEIFQWRGKKRKTQALNSFQYSSSTPSAMILLGGHVGIRRSCWILKELS
ncbi:hypothetical protein L3X38_010696 [Prunus dulcis]|uniref:Uncharacterized protein n=1 Tax=Prunus dulcis TaxID=3755 RepID=A0AAD4ZEB2_PRUDU|nr:hypothetical protein L3X38_010696 [Prunus dulcis]